MKVTGPNGVSTPAAGRASRAGASGFAPAMGGAASAASTSAPAVSGVGGLTALMALQGVEDVTQRRRRAVRRGAGLLDRLEELKLALLSDQAGAPALARLAHAVGEDRPEDDDPRLKSVLDQIDLRAAVELAKAQASRPA